jgi:uncharacterized protein with HEPN domain
MRYETLKRFEDARLACERISEFVAGRTKQEFVASALVRSAVERQLEIIGEALGRAAAEDPAAEPRVPDLRKIVGMRNRLIHGYGEVDYNVVWDTAMTKVPALRSQLEQVLGESESSD